MSAEVTERAPGVLVQETVDRLSAARGVARHGGLEESTSLKVAMYLEDHPRVEVSVAEVAMGTGLTRTQASSALQKFIDQRTDVERRGRGVYMYFPGRKAAKVPPDFLSAERPATGVYLPRWAEPSAVAWNEPPALTAPALPNVHPLVGDMLAMLPPPGTTFPVARRNAWLAAMSGILAVVYGEEGA